MPRQRSPNRDKAFEIWKESEGKKPLVEIAKELGIKDTQVRKWKSQDEWEQQLKGTLPKKKSNVTNKKTREIPKENNKILKELDEAELTEMQRLFCLYYVKSFNATMSAIKAGYAKDSAHVQGSRLLSNDKIKTEIRRLKGAVHEELFIDAMDVLKKYMAIAFADITDFVSFHQEEVPVMTAFGPLEVKNPKTGKKEVVTKMVNTVKFKNSTEVDGTILAEVSQGKDGAKIKLADKMKALEKLEKYFDLIPDTWKRKIEEEKLTLEKRKVEGEEETQNKVVIVNDKEEMRKAMMENDKDS